MPEDSGIVSPFCSDPGLADQVCGVASVVEAGEGPSSADVDRSLCFSKRLRLGTGGRPLRRGAISWEHVVLVVRHAPHGFNLSHLSFRCLQVSHTWPSDCSSVFRPSALSASLKTNMSRAFAPRAASVAVGQGVKVLSWS